MKLIFLTLLSIATAFGGIPAQWRDWSQPASGVSSPLNDVTNLAGYPIRAFYLPSDVGYVTNSSVATLVDYGPNAWNITNRAAGTLWPVRQISVAGINNKDSILFDGVNDYLNSTAYTNGPTHEIIMVFRYNDITNGANRFLFNGKGAASHRASHGASAQNLLFASTGTLSDGKMITNKWIVLDCISGATASIGITIYTNNVQAATSGTAQTRIMDGFTLAADNFLSSCGPLDLALMVTYGSSDTNNSPIPGTNTTARTSIFTALTNYFNLSP